MSWEGCHVAQEIPENEYTLPSVEGGGGIIILKTQAYERKVTGSNPSALLGYLLERSTSTTSHPPAHTTPQLVLIVVAVNMWNCVSEKQGVAEKEPVYSVNLHWLKKGCKKLKTTVLFTFRI